MLKCLWNHVSKTPGQDARYFGVIKAFYSLYKYRDMGTPHYSDRLCSDRRYSDNAQSGRRRRVADSSWIGLRAVPIGNTPNQIPKIRGSTIVLEVRCNFSGGGGTPDPTGIPSPGPAPLSHLSASINVMLSMRATPRPLLISSQFLLLLHMPSVLKMYWVIMTVDCRNSVCRNRVCRNSVCLSRDIDGV